MKLSKTIFKLKIPNNKIVVSIKPTDAEFKIDLPLVLSNYVTKLT